MMWIVEWGCWLLEGWWGVISNGLTDRRTGRRARRKVERLVGPMRDPGMHIE